MILYIMLLHVFVIFSRQFWCIDNSLFKEEEHKVGIDGVTVLSLNV